MEVCCPGFKGSGRSRTPMGWWGEVVKVVRGVEGGWFMEGVERVIGNCVDTYFWEEKCVGGVCLKVLFPRLYRLSLDREARVESMGVWVEGRWEWRWRRTLLDRESYMLNELIDVIGRVPIKYGVEDFVEEET